MGSAILRVGQVGVDPYTAANIGISNTIGIDLGTYQLISNAVLFIPMLLWGRQYIGIGSIMNMILVGYFVQWFSEEGREEGEARRARPEAQGEVLVS